MSVENGKVVIHAVHERDAEEFWKKLGLKETETCFVCGEGVTAKTFGAVAPFKGKVVVCCESPHCFFHFKLKMKEKEKEVE